MEKANSTTTQNTNANAAPGGFSGSNETPNTPKALFSAPSQLFAGNRSDILSSFISEVQSQLKATDLDMTIKAVDSKVEGLPMDGAVFTYMLGRVAVVAYVGIINTCQNLQPRGANNGQQTIIYDMYPQDIVTDERALNAIRKVVKTGLDANQILSTVPVYLSLTSSPADTLGFTDEVKAILHTVWSAIQVEIGQYLTPGMTVPDSYKPYHGNNYMTAAYVEHYNGKDAKIEITHERRSDLTMSSTSGVPINPDIIFTASVRGKNRDDQMWSSTDSAITRVGISADIMRAGEPKVDSEGRVLPGQSATKPSQWYYPVIRFDAIQTNAPSVASTLLGLIVGAAPFANNNAHIYPFMVDQKDLRSKMAKLNHLGGTGCELTFLHNDPAKTAGNAIKDFPSMSDRAVKVNLISSILRNKPRFMMVCSALQSDFCFTSLIKKAAHRSVNGVMSESPTDMKAYNAFIAAADELTGNRFSANFKKGTPIAVTTDSLRPIGTLENEDGVQNVNKITYMTLTNLFSGKKEQLDSLAEYTANMYGGTGDGSRIRMHKNIQYIQGILGSVRVVGYGEELELNGDMLRILINSYIDSGVPINTPESIGYNINTNNDRAFFGDQFGGAWGGANTNQSFAGASGFSGGFVSNSHFTF